MNCASCGERTGPSARFCGGCGKPLAPRCPACGARSEPDAQFCDAAAPPLAAPRRPTTAVARKVVTIVFADLIGSTALHERLDAESARRVMDRYYRALRAAVEAHGGTVVKLLGDGVMAAFGVPRVAEDDAIRAVRAAVGMQHAFRELAARAERGGRQTSACASRSTPARSSSATTTTDVIGDPVNVAARLQQEAHDGDVLIGESTRRLVGELVTLAPFGVVRAKGRAETVAAYRVVSLERPAGARGDARSSGATTSCGASRRSTTRPSRRRRARLAVILGSPGLGKSRLLAELARRLGDARDRAHGALRRGRRRHLRAARRGAARAPAPRRRQRRRRAARGDRRRGRPATTPSAPASPAASPRCSPARRRRRRRPSSSSAASSPRSPRRSRWCSRSTTCSGRSRCCST